MLIFELTKYSLSTSMINQAPFVYSSLPGIHTTADYWQTAFGCPDESVLTNIYVSSLIQDSVVFYAVMISLLDCIAQEASFYFLVLTETLYAHYDHESNRWSNVFEYGDQLGFTDTKDLYIDNVYYASMIRSFPSAKQQEDIIAYTKAAKNSGSITLDNTACPNTQVGRLDDLITRKLYGNDAILYRLTDIPGVYDFHRSDLVALHAASVDDYDITLTEAVIKLLDKLSAQNINIPTETFTLSDYPDLDDSLINTVIPLMYGFVRCSEAIPTNTNDGAADVTYRQAQRLTVLGTVQVLIDDLWTIKVPISTDLVNGTFTLDAADSRNASDVPYDCRVLGSIGIPNAYSSDIIKDLNQCYLGILYTGSSYDQVEWEAEQIQLASIGIVFNKQIEIQEAIRQVNAGSNIRFRYETNAIGQRTIRIDDHERAVSRHVCNADIHNITQIPVKGRKDLLASVVEVSYAKDYFDDVFLKAENNANQDYVLTNYRQIKKVLQLETALTNSTDADEFALLMAGRYRDLPRIAEIELRGEDYYDIRIYDILTIELSPAVIDAASARVVSGREYFGTWKVKILSVDPRFGSITNIVTALLIEQIEPVTIVRITTTGKIRQCGISGTAILKRGCRDGT